MNEVNLETKVLDCTALRAYYELMTSVALKKFIKTYNQLNDSYNRSIADNEQRIRIINEILKDR